MSLIGFKASNHPQQTALRGALDEVDDRGTKWEYVRSLEERFGQFTLDVAAAPHNAKAERFYTRADDGLTQPWWGRQPEERVWCNPPYSRVRSVVCDYHLARPDDDSIDCECAPSQDLGSWVQKAWNEWNDGTRHHLPGYTGTYRPQEERPGLIAMLVPANRVEQAWWQDLVEPYRDRPDSPLSVEFQRGRMRFDMPPDWVTPDKGDRPPFGLALLIWSPYNGMSTPPGPVQP